MTKKKAKRLKKHLFNFFLGKKNFYAFQKQLAVLRKRNIKFKDYYTHFFSFVNPFFNIIWETDGAGFSANGSYYMDNIMLELKPTDIVFVYCTDYYYKNGFILTDDDFHDIDYRTFGNWHFNFTNS